LEFGLLKIVRFYEKNNTVTVCDVYSFSVVRKMISVMPIRLPLPRDFVFMMSRIRYFKKCANLKITGAGMTDGLFVLMVVV
jgi:hypothetical protein